MLKTLGVGVGTGMLFAGSASAESTPSADIELTDEGNAHVFDPPSYETAPGTVTWLHNDPTPGGIVHNVRIHADGDPTKQLNSPRLAFGDTYTIDFELSDGTLMASDHRKTIAIDVSGKNTQEFGVHCDYHLGQTNLAGAMKMDEFVVNL